MSRTADKTDIPHRLTQAGRELFSRQGYNATGIQQITDHAGVPKGSFYNHFESKEVFAVAIIGQYAEHLQQSWEAMMAAAPAQPMGAIRYVFAQMIAYHERRELQSGCLVGNFAAEMAQIGQAAFPAHAIQLHGGNARNQGIDHGLDCGRNGRKSVGLQRAAIAKVEIVVHR